MQTLQCLQHIFLGELVAHFEKTFGVEPRWVTVGAEFQATETIKCKRNLRPRPALKNFHNKIMIKVLWLNERCMQTNDIFSNFTLVSLYVVR